MADEMAAVTVLANWILAEVVAVFIVVSNSTLVF